MKITKRQYYEMRRLNAIIQIMWFVIFVSVFGLVLFDFVVSPSILIAFGFIGFLLYLFSRMKVNQILRKK